MSRRIDVPTLRAAWWAFRALRRARRTLRKRGLEGFSVSSPPQLPEQAARGVLAVLRRRSSTCLERALVLQRWHAAQGHSCDVVIGVAGSAERFAAHAWLDGELDGQAESFQELMRVPLQGDSCPRARGVAVSVISGGGGGGDDDGGDD